MKPAAAGFFPLDEQLQLWDQHWSEQVAKQAVRLSGLMKFEDAETVLRELGQIVMSDTSVWRRVQVWGERAQALEAAQRAEATTLPDRRTIVPGEATGEARLAVALDGAMVNIRGEGWKELKTGCVGAIEIKPTLDSATGDWVELAHTGAHTYVAHLGGPEHFGQQLWAEAQARHWTQAADTIVLGDGAAWVWNLAREHFFDSRQAVDWYHAKQHLCQAAALVAGEGTPAAERWLTESETCLFEGQADQIADRLDEAAKHKRKVAKDLRQQAGYFRDNQRRMQYLELREDGYPRFRALSERLESLKERHEQGQLHSIAFLKQLLDLAKDLVQAEKDTPPEEDEDRGKAALTELFQAVRNPETPIIVERLVGEIDSIVRMVRFAGWQNTTAGEREVKKALRKTLFNYKLHQDTELFEKAYGYIRQYY